MEDHVNVTREGILVACGDVAHGPIINKLVEEYYVQFASFVYANSFDRVMLPGGQHFMQEPGTAVRDFMIGQIMKYAILHGLNDVVVVLPRECGAYGGEETVTNAQIQDAKALAIKLEEPGLHVVILADVDGEIVLYDSLDRRR